MIPVASAIGFIDREIRSLGTERIALADVAR